MKATLSLNALDLLEGFETRFNVRIFVHQRIALNALDLLEGFETTYSEITTTTAPTTLNALDLLEGFEKNKMCSLVFMDVRQYCPYE